MVRMLVIKGAVSMAYPREAACKYPASFSASPTL